METTKMEEEILVGVQTTMQQLTQHISNQGFIMNNLANQISIQGVGNSIEPFDGDPNKFKEWMRALDKYSLLNNLSDDKKVCIAFQTSRKIVSDYIFRWQTEERDPNWAGLKQELFSRFSPIVDAKHAKNMLRRSRQKPDENIIAYSTRLHNLSYEAYSGAANQEYVETELIEAFVDGLHNQRLKFKLMERDPKTFKEAVKIAKDDQNLRTMFALRTKTSTEEPMEVDTLRKRRCHYCDKAGHIAVNCRLRQRQQSNKQINEIQNMGSSNQVTRPEPRQLDRSLLCYYCGQPGHFKRNCVRLKRDRERQGQSSFQRRFNPTPKTAQNGRLSPDQGNF